MFGRNDRFRSALLCGAVLVGGGAAQAATISGNVAPWVAHAAAVGTAKDDKTVTVVLHMALKNVAALKQLVADVSRPASPRYGQYLTNSVFLKTFAPAADDVAAATALLSGAGMRNVTAGPGGAYVMADATVGQLRRTFGVSQKTYSFAGHTLRANAEAPTIPDALAGKVLYVEGLDESGVLRTPMHHSVVQGSLYAPAAASADVTPPPVAAELPSPYCDTYYGDLRATLSTKPAPYNNKQPWLVCGYTPKQIEAAYGEDKVTEDGKGVTVAILDAYASPTLKDDGNRYAANHHLPPLTSANFKQIIPMGIHSVDPAEECGPYGWWGEQSLDLAAVHGTAPGASIVYVGSRDCEASLSVALLNVIYNKQADIATNSYSFNGEADSAADIAMDDQAFLAAAAQGMTILFSSGDDGDLSQVNGVATGTLSADSPYVTGVGGTTLALFDAKGRKKEFGWGTYRDYLAGATVNSGTSVTTSGLTTTSYNGIVYDAFSFYSGSGGGVSLVEPQPAYQAGVVPDSLSTQVYYANGYTVPLPMKMRVSPDISMLADPYTGYLYGESFTIAGNPVADHGCTPYSKTVEYCEGSIGGTSLASPLMAGVVARWNQARAKAGKPMAGFINPLLYSLPTGVTLKSAAVNDVLPPNHPMALLRGYANNPNLIRLVTVNSVPFNIRTAPFPLETCSLPICEGIDDVFDTVTTGYDNTTGLGVPWVPKLIQQ